MSDILCVKGSVFLRKIVPKFYQKLFSKPSKILSQNAVQLGVIVYHILLKKGIKTLHQMWVKAPQFLSQKCILKFTLKVFYSFQFSSLKTVQNITLNAF